MPPGFMWVVAAAPFRKERLDLVGTLSLAGCITPVRVKTVVTGSGGTPHSNPGTSYSTKLNTGLS